MHNGEKDMWMRYIKAQRMLVDLNNEDKETWWQNDPYIQHLFISRLQTKEERQFFLGVIKND